MRVLGPLAVALVAAAAAAAAPLAAQGTVPGVVYDLSQRSSIAVTGLASQDSLVLVLRVQADRRGHTRADVLQGMLGDRFVAVGDYTIADSSGITVVFPARREYAELGPDGGARAIAEYQRTAEDVVHRATLDSLAVDTLADTVTADGRPARQFRIRERGTTATTARTLSSTGSFTVTTAYLMAPCAAPGAVSITNPAGVAFVSGPALPAAAVARIRRAVAALPGCPVRTDSRLVLVSSLAPGVSMAATMTTTAEVTGLELSPVAPAAFAVPAGYTRITFAQRMKELDARR